MNVLLCGPDSSGGSLSKYIMTECRMTKKERKLMFNYCLFFFFFFLVCSQDPICRGERKKFHPEILSLMQQIVIERVRQEDIWWLIEPGIAAIGVFHHQATETATRATAGVQMSQASLNWARRGN